MTGNHLDGKTESDVEALIIKNQNVTFLPNDLGEKFENLKRLEVTSSNLKAANDENFEQMNLQTLKLRKNSLEKFDVQIFDDLEELNLDENQISEIGYLKSETLEIISINYNQLNNLTTDNFKSLPNLMEFYAKNNKIEVLKSEFFRHNEKLTKVDFSNNNLDFIDFKIANKFSNFDLSGNPCLNDHEVFNETSIIDEKVKESCGNEESRIFKKIIKQLKTQTNELLKELDENKQETSKSDENNSAESTSNSPNNDVNTKAMSKIQRIIEIIKLIKHLETEFDSKLEKINDLTKENENLKNKNNNSDENDKINDKSSEKVDNSVPECKNQSTEETTTENSCENDEITKENEDLKSKVVDLKNDIKTCEAKITDLYETQSLLSESNVKNKDLENQVEKLQDQVQDHEIQVKSFELQVQTCESERSDCQDQLRDIQDQAQKLNICQDQLEKSDENAQNLKTETQNLKRINFDLADQIKLSTDNYSRLTDSYNQLSGGYDRINTNLTFLTEDYNALIVERENLDYEFNVCQNKVNFYALNCDRKAEGDSYFGKLN